MKTILILFLSLILTGTATFAQDVEFTASISKNPLSKGERAQITYRLNDAGSNFRAPDFSGFRILSGPSQSTSTRIINNNMSREYSFSYVVEPLKDGIIEISPATITVNGKQIKSNSLRIQVLPETQAQKQRREQEEQREQSLDDQAKQILSKNLYARLNVNKSTVYEGEQIVATYTIYKNPDIRLVNLEHSKLPTFNGFWTQEIDIGELRFEYEIVDGVRFEKAVIKKVVLFPQRSGKLEIDPYEFKFTARLQVNSGGRSRDPFDSFFGRNYRDFDYSARSNTAAINVKALPENPPLSFNGAVGDLKMEAWFDKTESVQNDPFTLRVKISGKGNLQLIQALNIEVPPGFESYEPKSSDNINVGVGGVTGSKTFEYLLMPRNEGTYEIEPIEYSYFDLAKEEYVTLSSDKFTLTVKKGKGDDGSSYVSGIRKEDVELLGSDIRYIKTNGNISKGTCGFFGSAMFYIFSILPLILFAALIVMVKKKHKTSANVKLVRNKKANKIAKKRLASAKSYMSSGDRNKFYEELTKALWGYAGDKLGIVTSELNKDTLMQKMLQYNISEEKINNFIGTLDKCEFARYAPSSSDTMPEEIYNEAVNTIMDIEGALK